jgi:DNA-binding GntR family transcriptional regulator
MADVKKRDILASRLRADILSGRYGPEGGLPEVNELVKTSGFARGTVNSALTLLEGQGLIVERGRTYYVNRVFTSMTNYLPAPRDRYAGQNFVRNIVPAKRVRSIPEELALYAGINAKTPAVWTVRVSGSIVDGKEKPVMVISRYYVFPLTDDHIKHMHDDAGYEPAWHDPMFPKELKARDRDCARETTEEEATQLGVSFPSPVLSVQEVMRDLPGDVVLVQEAVLTERTTMEYEYQYSNQQPS